jgi:type VI secretion system protein ImpB
VQLKFESMEDFEPARVANQIEPLRKLLQDRDKLRDLLTKVDLSDELETILQDVMTNTEKLSQLSKELGLSSGAGDAGSDGNGGDA